MHAAFLARPVPALLVVAVLLAARAAGAVPSEVPYTGYLTHEDGTPFEGSVEVQLALYDQAEDGAPIWGPHDFVEVVEGGMLQVVLGGEGSPPLDDAVLGPEGAWLAIAVDGTPMEPRQRVLSVPYALRAGDAERLGGADAAAFVTDAELPDFAAFVRGDALAAVATTGAYADLSGRPDLSGYALTADLQPVCWSGSYADLADTPDLTVFVPRAELAAVALSGAYGDLTGTPDLSLFLRADGTVALAGPLDLAGQPLSNVVIAASDEAPAAPVAGQLWWNATVGALEVFSGSEWIVAGGAGGGQAAVDLSCAGCVAEEELAFSLAAVALSGAYGDIAGAPDPSLLLRTDGTVALGGPWDLGGHALSNLVVAAGEAPAAPVAGQLWWDDGVRALRVYTGTEWVLAGAAGAGGAAVDLDCVGCVSETELAFPLAAVATSGSYEDLLQRPDLSVYTRSAELADVATSGS